MTNNQHHLRGISIRAPLFSVVVFGTSLGTSYITNVELNANDLVFFPYRK